MTEQELEITTYIKLDVVDRIKILFGRCFKVDTKIIVPYEQPILFYNANSTTSIVSSTGNFVKQDRPPFGYIQTGDSNK